MQLYCCEVANFDSFKTSLNFTGRTALPGDQPLTGDQPLDKPTPARYV